VAKTAPGTRLVVTGRGFASFQGLTSTLAGVELNEISKTDTQLVLELEAGQSYPEGEQPLVVGVPGTSYEDRAKLTLET
jgi:hypothetical protein